MTTRTKHQVSDLAKALKRKRSESGLTTRALAKIIGSSFATISRIVRFSEWSEYRGERK